MNAVGKNPDMAPRDRKGDPDFGKRLRDARQGISLSRADLAERLHVSPGAVQQWEDGWAMPQAARLQALSRAVGRTVEDLMGQSTPINPPPDLPGERLMPAPMIIRRAELPLDVPVLGTAVGGTGGDFSLNGEVVDYVRRPPALATAKNAFAVFYSNDSMWPLYEQGDPIYIDPSRRPRPGDYVLIEMHGIEGTPGPAYIKRLVKRTEKQVIAAQYNPPKDDIRFDAGRIKAMWRIVPTKELLGI